MIYDGYTTDFDLMKEELIQGAELTDYWNFPLVGEFHGEVKQTVSFKESFSKELKNIENITLNFFEDDCYFNQVWNNPFRYLEHFQKFKSVCMPDFSKAEEAPMPINIWNNYRNMALARWMLNNGIKVVPSISTLPESCWEWCFDGFPKYSVYCCCTNGFIKNSYKREYFKRSFAEAVKRFEPERVYMVGREIADLDSDCDVIYLNSCSMNNRNRIRRANVYTANRIERTVQY